jgi:antitoxin ParD1/3/4
MATMNISLPGPMKTWVENQTKNGRYGNASDYIRDLIRRDQDRRAKVAAFERLVDEGFECGIVKRSPEAILAEVRRRSGSDDSDGL